MLTPLTGHTSPETAYVVDDYPYGFRLRCKIRYWLEYKPGKGFRFVSQTTNPKRGNTWTNKPKASTYVHGLAAMMLDPDTGHVKWSGISFSFSSAAGLQSYLDEKRAAFPDHAITEAEKYIRIKTTYEKLKDGGMPYQLAAAAAIKEEHEHETT